MGRQSRKRLRVSGSAIVLSTITADGCVVWLRLLVINYVNRLQDELVEKETEAQAFPELHQTIRDLEVEIKASKDMAYRMSASVHNDVTNAVRERDRYWQGLVEQRDHEIRRLKGEVMGVRDSWERVVAEKNEELEELRGSMEKAESLLYIALRKPSSA